MTIKNTIKATLAADSHGSPALVFGVDEEVARWTADRLNEESFGFRGWQNAAAIGVVLRGQPIAGVVYTHYSGPNIQMSIATTDRRWCSRGRLRVFFAYPFLQLGCRRVTGICHERNHRSRRLMEGLGFTHEGTHPEMFADGDGLSFGMLRNDCRWIGDGNGQRRQPAAPA